MIVLLSPAKTLDFNPTKFKKHTTPRLLEDSEQLVDVLKKQSANKIKTLMKVSDKLAALNHERYQQFQTPFTLDNAKQSILAFKGDVYSGLDADSMDAKDLTFAQKHLRILSGLYGVLAPLDLMQAYRLEMGTKLKNGKNKNLYEFWDSRITDILNTDLSKAKSKVFLNLASQEYFHSVKTDQLKGELVHVHFKELRNGAYKVIAFNAKKARGAMAREIIKNRITKVGEIKKLKINDYVYKKDLSDGVNYFFGKD